MRLSIGAPPDSPLEEKDCCIGWQAEAQRALLLLETLAEDHFADQEAFDKWVQDQQRLVLGRRRA
jgi:hypothetical protein